jgi:hypothetical protein
VRAGEITTPANRAGLTGAEHDRLSAEALQQLKNEANAVSRECIKNAKEGGERMEELDCMSGWGPRSPVRSALHHGRREEPKGAFDEHLEKSFDDLEPAVTSGAEDAAGSRDASDSEEAGGVVV